jgi:hypothetical protein
MNCFRKRRIWRAGVRKPKRKYKEEAGPSELGMTPNSRANSQARSKATSKDKGPERFLAPLGMTVKLNSEFKRFGRGRGKQRPYIADRSQKHIDINIYVT